jgi:hypothetical protein
MSGMSEEQRSTRNLLWVITCETRCRGAGGRGAYTALARALRETGKQGGVRGFKALGWYGKARRGRVGGGAFRARGAPRFGGWRERCGGRFW